jgi:hypothetical protein
MEPLVSKFRSLLAAWKVPYKRSLFDKINWSARAIRIDGARGVGKSTLMLQYARERLPLEKSLYITLDDLYFRAHTLTEVAEDFYRQGGRHLLLDEVHKYKDWQVEVKNVYDFLQDLQLIVSGSSILALQKSDADLSRRVVNYHLPTLSFREYLGMGQQIDLPLISLEDLISRHAELATEWTARLKSPLAHFRRFGQHGAYPFFLEGESDFLLRLNQLINVIIDYDLPEVKAIEGPSLGKLKRLLYIISRSVPFTPNILKLAEDIGTSRNRLLEMLDVLEKARLIRNLRAGTKGVSLMNKPDKVFLNNPSLIYTMAEGNPNEGNLRETFFFSQLEDAGHKVSYPKSADFLIDGKYLFEIGGKGKPMPAPESNKEAFVVSDNLEIGSANRIPLWLFGFLY